MGSEVQVWQKVEAYPEPLQKVLPSPQSTLQSSVWLLLLSWMEKAHTSLRNISWLLGLAEYPNFSASGVQGGLELPGLQNSDMSQTPIPKKEGPRLWQGEQGYHREGQSQTSGFSWSCRTLEGNTTGLSWCCTTPVLQEASDPGIPP